MKSLLSKSSNLFFICTAIIMLCCFPLFFLVMKYFYAEDLDELILYRTDHFIAKHLPSFTIADIEYWNKFNEDMQIYPFSPIYPLDQVGQKPFYNEAEGHGVDYRIVYTRISIEEKPYVFMSRIAMIETRDLMRTLGVQYGLFLLIITSGLVIMQRMLSRRLWKPFYTSLDIIENFSLDKGVIPSFDPTDIREFTRLNTNLTKLIQNNISTYKQQKEFTENASHELQTPLAVFQSQLDLLLQDSSLTESQMKVIQSLYDVSSRLTRLNKNLLLLARIDNSQFKETEQIDLTQLVNTQLIFLRDLAEHNGITLSTETDQPLIVKGNKILIESLINNLIINAIRHNQANGTLLIRIRDNSFIISNTGEDTALDTDKIFRRFSRISEKRKGNGLGLSIVSQICRLHGWEINYEFKNHLHTFSVQFTDTRPSH